MTDSLVLGFAMRGGALGLMAGISPGPLMALVVSLSVTYRAREGVKAALAPLFTDLPILLCALAAVGALAGNATVMGLLSLAGSLCLGYYAFESLRFSPKPDGGKPDKPASLMRGIVANFLNPNPYIFWSTVGAPLLVEAKTAGPVAPVAFAAAFFAGICGLKAAIAVASARASGWLGSRGYVLAVRLSGVGLLIFAADFLRDALARFGLM